MENYYGTREQWVWPGLLSIRSIGIQQMKLDYNLRIQRPGDCYYQSRKTAVALVNFMSYFYTAMSIAIPEAFNTNARPVVSGEFDWVYFQNLDNSNGTALNATNTAASPVQQSAGTKISKSVSATVDSPPSPTGLLALAAFTTISTISFPNLTDWPHTNTENCFPFLPSISVTGSPTLECDCMTTTAPLTILGGSTRCALSNTLFFINPWRASTGISGVSTVRPMTTTPAAPPLPPPPATSSAAPVDE